MSKYFKEITANTDWEALNDQQTNQAVWLAQWLAFEISLFIRTQDATIEDAKEILIHHSHCPYEFNFQLPQSFYLKLSQIQLANI